MQKKEYSFEELSTVFHVPFIFASIQLGISTVELRAQMKRLQIDRWPYNYKKIDGSKRVFLNMFADYKISKKMPKENLKIIKVQQPLKLKKMNIQNLIH